MKTNSFTKLTRASALAAFFAATACAGATTVVVDVDYADLGNGSYLYQVTITNNCPDDLITVGFPNAPTNDSLLASTAISPMGFNIDYEPSFGTLDLNTDTMNFAAGGTVSGFSFQSAGDPVASFGNFEAFTTNFDFVAGTTNLNLVPEPTSLALLGFTSLFVLRRRRHS